MKLTPIHALLLAALSATSAPALAHPNSVGYAYDSQNVVARDGFGNCVRTNEWAVENAIPECGGKAVVPAAPVQIAETAPVVAPTPAPAAAPVSAPAPTPTPIPTKVELSADELFDFGKAELKGGAQTGLNKFATDLNGVNFDKVTIIGHTDRIGSKTRNQKLSEARAASVKAFLVSKGIPANKIATEGRGSSDPVTKADGAKKLKGGKLHDYLAPDRRVSIRVAGTRLK
ncbi:MAG: OmpA family protein [Nitrosomonadales bacterium]|nr:OmpA family protein [Nitrosomonadales bacterium]